MRKTINKASSTPGVGKATFSHETANSVRKYLLPEIKISVSFDKKVRKSELYVIKSSGDIYLLLKQIFNKDTFDWKEEVIILCLNRNNKVLGYYKVSSGGMSGTIVDPKVVFTVALNCTATAIILAHNHPSGNLMPSREDVQLSNTIKSCGRILDIKLLDNLILGENEYFSFSDSGVL